MLIDKDSRLHIFINGQDQGVVAEALPSKRYVVVDLYGSCQEICIVPSVEQNSPCELKDENKTAEGMVEQTKGPCDYRLLCERFRSTLALPGKMLSFSWAKKWKKGKKKGRKEKTSDTKHILY